MSRNEETNHRLSLKEPPNPLNTPNPPHPPQTPPQRQGFQGGMLITQEITMTVVFQHHPLGSLKPFRIMYVKIKSIIRSKTCITLVQYFSRSHINMLSRILDQRLWVKYTINTIIIRSLASKIETRSLSCIQQSQVNGLLYQVKDMC